MYLNNGARTAIKNHLQQCKSCSMREINLYSSFAVLNKCSFEYNAKIHKALFIKQINHFLLNYFLGKWSFRFTKNILIYLSYSVTVYQFIVFDDIS